MSERPMSEVGPNICRVSAVDVHLEGAARMAVRQFYTATIEAGSLSGMVRLELPDMHLWLYPQEDGTVRIETEDKRLLDGQDEYQIGECAFVPAQETVIRVADVDGDKVYAEFTSGETRWIAASDLRKL